jgi:hypothetical protein
MRPLILALLGACYQATPDSPADEARPAFVPDTGGDTAAGDTFPADTAPPPPPPTGPITIATPGTVGAIQADPTFCWLTRTNGGGSSIVIDVVGLGSSQLANLSVLPPTPGLRRPTSILRERSQLVVVAPVSPFIGITRAFFIDARTGAPINDRQLNRESLHAAGSTYLEEIGGTYNIRLFTSIADVLTGPGVRSGASNMTVWGNGDVSYPATSSRADSVRLYHPASLAFRREVATVGFRGRVDDVQLQGNRIYLLDDGRSGAGSGGQLLWVFNSNTGAHLRSVEFPAGSTYSAFVCRSAP